MHWWGSIWVEVGRIMFTNSLESNHQTQAKYVISCPTLRVQEVLRLNSQRWSMSMSQISEINTILFRFDV